MSKPMITLKKPNVFALLMAVSVFAIVLRLFNIAHFQTPVSIAENAPPPKKFEQVDEQPPPLPAKNAPEAAAAPHNKETAPHNKETAPPEKAAAKETAPPVPYGEPSFSASEIEVLQSLSKRRDEIDKREQQLIKREALLKAAGSEVDRKVAELNKIKAELETLLNKQKTLEDERITSLVKIYENMKPKEAARIFDTLEMDVLLSVIAKMSERKTSPILAGMDPERARQVTIQLAEQRKLPDAPATAGKTPPAAVPAPGTLPSSAPAKPEK